ncbi:hypothetical protein KKI24_22350 [bacterium]|nr:hypothetical protein [bacterium]
MKHHQDRTICSLVKKKKELLNQLLVHSIQSAINEENIEPANPDRENILTALSTNDRFLEMRERELGVEARILEARLFRDIEWVLTAIRDNNNQTIVKLEREKRIVERERSRLSQENKLSGYLNQNRGIKNRIPVGKRENSMLGTGPRLLSGTL